MIRDENTYDWGRYYRTRIEEFKHIISLIKGRKLKEMHDCNDIEKLQKQVEIQLLDNVLDLAISMLK